MNSELTREWRKWHNISVYETGRPPTRPARPLPPLTRAARPIAALPPGPACGRAALLRRRAEQQPAQRRHALLQPGHLPGQLSHPRRQAGILRPQRGGRGLQLRDPRLGPPPGPGTPVTDLSILIDRRHGKHMIQHTPLQQPRHVPTPACRDPSAPRPTGSPITYSCRERRTLIGVDMPSNLCLQTCSFSMTLSRDSRIQFLLNK